MLNIEECELLGDSKYRAYISQVEKALKSFENTSEWADLISALGKLNKVIFTNVTIDISRKYLFDSCLVHCNAVLDDALLP